MNFKKEISRKSFFSKLSIIGSCSIFSAFYARNRSRRDTKDALFRLESRFKKPKKSIPSDLLS